MSTLVAITYDNEFKAGEVLETLRQLQSDHLIDLQDAVYITNDVDGKIEVHEGLDQTPKAATKGAMWGLLAGVIFPPSIIAGAAVGGGIGALVGHFKNYGIDKEFVENLRAELTPATSALVVLVRSSTPERVLPEIAPYGGTVVQTTLSSESEAKLQEALQQAPETTPA
jgi:uncharacterized membrane protein